MDHCCVVVKLNIKAWKLLLMNLLNDNLIKLNFNVMCMNVKMNFCVFTNVDIVHQEFEQSHNKSQSPVLKHLK